VVGLVVDSASLKGIPGAVVQARLVGVKLSGVYSDSVGGFVIGRLRPGRYQLLARRLGYAPAKVDLEALPARIDTIVVRLQGADATIYESWGSYDSVGPNDRPCVHQTRDAKEALDDYRRTAADEDRIKWRTTLSLPAVPVDQITLVSDPAVCSRALDSFNHLFKGDDKGKPIRAVWVIRYGSTRFIVGNPNGPHLGEWKAQVVFDSTFKMITTAGR
jgi:hypothetical protein